jgi:hypothetical protein
VGASRRPRVAWAPSRVHHVTPPRPNRDGTDGGAPDVATATATALTPSERVHSSAELNCGQRRAVIGRRGLAPPPGAAWALLRPRRIGTRAQPRKAGMSSWSWSTRILLRPGVDFELIAVDDQQAYSVSRGRATGSAQAAEGIRSHTLYAHPPLRDRPAAITW